MSSTARALFGAMVFLIATGCDETARAVREIQRPLDPIVGIWREVTPYDTGNVSTLAFSSNGSLKMTILRRDRADSSGHSAADSFANWVNAYSSSLPYKYSRGEDILVFSVEKKAIRKALLSSRLGSAMLAEDNQIDTVANQRDTIGVFDMAFKYRLSGDVLEITEEKNENVMTEPKTQRLVRVRK
jgi:hypothetical protein